MKSPEENDKTDGTMLMRTNGRDQPRLLTAAREKSSVSDFATANNG
jgi:hypothetical protein